MPGSSPSRTLYSPNLASLPSPRSRQTVMERLRAVAQLVEIEDTMAFPWHQLRFQHIDYIRARLIEKDPSTEKRRSPATVNLTLAALRGIARYVRNYNLMSDEEYRRICDVKPDSGERLPVAVLYIGGVRRAELAGLDVADYTPDPPALKVRAGKGNKDQVVPLIGSAAAALDDWLALRGRAPGQPRDLQNPAQAPGPGRRRGLAAARFPAHVCRYGVQPGYV